MLRHALPCCAPCSFETVFVAHRWIATPKASLSPAHAVMVLFAATRLPQDEPPFVQKLREQELGKLRGVGLEAAVLTGRREGADSVYDYQVCLCLCVSAWDGHSPPHPGSMSPLPPLSFSLSPCSFPCNQAATVGCCVLCVSV